MCPSAPDTAPVKDGTPFPGQQMCAEMWIMMKNLKTIWARYKHGVPMLAYMVIYLAWFAWLEKTNTKNYWVIHMPLDDYIPFCEVFIIPYLLWFAYVAAVIIYLFFRDKQEFQKTCTFLITGMTLFLVISTLWPNGHDLRPAAMPRDNVFTALISLLWKADTSTNLWPSIHVFNSMGAHFGITHCKRLMSSRHGRSIRLGSGILAVSIILSTVFIKQHSLFDLVTGLALGIVMWVVIYKQEWMFADKTQHTKNKRTPQVD